MHAFPDSDLRPVPCILMRGGTSRGPFFRAGDLPPGEASRDRVLLAAMGSPDARQIDGLGGAHPLTSKAGIVGPGTPGQYDLSFLFAQLQPDADTVDTTPNCGNMLAAVMPFALEAGLLAPQGDTTRARVLTRNTGMLCDITVATPGGRLRYAGDARIDGVPGTGAPIVIDFLDTAGSVCSALLPTGNACDTLHATDANGADIFVDATLIDNGMPMVLLRAGDLGRTGAESVAALNDDAPLKSMLEALRIAAGHKMGLGDVSARSYPKMCLIAAPRAGGALATRCFIPHVCHTAIGVLAAVTAGTACVLPGTVAAGLAQVSGNGPVHSVSIEHPSGEFTVEIETDPERPATIARSALVRTARPIMRGEVLIPAAAWPAH